MLIENKLNKENMGVEVDKDCKLSENCTNCGTCNSCESFKKFIEYSKGRIVTNGVYIICAEPAAIKLHLNLPFSQWIYSHGLIERIRCFFKIVFYFLGIAIVCLIGSVLFRNCIIMLSTIIFCLFFLYLPFQMIYEDLKSTHVYHVVFSNEVLTHCMNDIQGIVPALEIVNKADRYRILKRYFVNRQNTEQPPIQDENLNMIISEQLKVLQRNLEKVNIKILQIVLE